MYETEDLTEWVYKDYQFQMRKLNERKKQKQKVIENLVQISRFEDFADEYRSKCGPENGLIR